MYGIEIALILFIVLICILNIDRNLNLSLVFFYSFIIRIILIILDIYIFEIPFSRLDSGGFERKAAVWGELGLKYSISNFL